MLSLLLLYNNNNNNNKVGYAGQNFPSSIFPSMIGRPILRAEEAISETIELKDIMCGDEAAAAGDEQKKLKLESEYVAKRAEYYQKMVQSTTKIKTALEAELSELSQA